jgi:peroxiredoxin
VRWQIPPYLRALHEQLGADIPEFNGEESWTLPMPSRFVIDADGMIVYADVDADFRRRGEPTDLLPILDQVRRLASR